MNNTSLKTHAALAVMMFMQYLLVAVWWVPMAAYLTNTGIEGGMKALILSSMAIGSMASPIIGALADKYFSAQKVLAVSNLLTALLLAGTGFIQNPIAVFILIFVAMICYMPTWSLTGSIAMTHANPELFPRIRMFGSIGWVVSGLFSLLAVPFGVKIFDGGNLPFLCGSVLALIAAALNFTLPDTPPAEKTSKISLRKLLGLDALSLFRDKNYLLFMACSFAAVLPFTLYFSFCSEFLQDRQFKYITVTMNWGQLAELIFLFFTTTIMTKLGIKKAIVIGIAAMVARYLAFYWGVLTDVNAWYIIGILFHGLIFGLFFVGGQVYTDKKAPKALRAQAQGMLSFILWGIALICGNFISGKLIMVNTTVDAAGTTVYNWATIYAVTTIFTVIVLLLFILFFKQEKEEPKL
ncbi:MAG: MFS transporter [Candidatus Symbiothrix sp.]|jgi:nucleoside transporter|nr:MFS transporter [Candidatus Symbiothrix sp.]